MHSSYNETLPHRSSSSSFRKAYDSRKFRALYEVNDVVVVAEASAGTPHRDKFIVPNGFIAPLNFAHSNVVSLAYLDVECMCVCERE